LGAIIILAGRIENCVMQVQRRKIMGNKKTVGIALIVVGVVLIIVSLVADRIGIGAASGFGYKQIIGAIVGVVVAIIGFIYYSRK
jgi:hypothetical protein